MRGGDILMKKWIALFVVILIMAFGLLLAQAAEKEKTMEEMKMEKPVGTDLVLIGAALFNYDGIGTEKASCASCHSGDKALKDITKKKSWMGGKAKTLIAANNMCITMNQKGKPWTLTSVQMKALLAYEKTLK